MMQGYLRKNVFQPLIRVFPAFAVVSVVSLLCTGAVVLWNDMMITQCRKVFTEISGCSVVNTTSAQWAVPSPLPWNTIGGCGASGSGSVGDGIQWIGKGVHGGLIDIEVLSRYTIRKNYQQFGVTPRFSFKPTWTTEAGFSVPIVSKNGSVQYQTNQPDNGRTTGGIGDVTLDMARSVGFSGEYRLQLSLTVPTGQYDIKRGPESNLQFLPVDFQMGTGMYSATLLLSRSFDVEDGFWKVDASYTHPFNMHPISKENSMLDEYYTDYNDRKDNERFYYRFKSYGESDLGAYTAPSVSLAGYYAYRGEAGYVHSFGMLFSAPLGVAWIPEPSINSYKPIADPGHKAWSGALIYGLEFSRSKYPILLAFSIPFHDKADPKGNFDSPDWSSFLNEWIFAFGIKSTLF